MSTTALGVEIMLSAVRSWGSLEESVNHAHLSMESFPSNFNLPSLKCDFFTYISNLEIIPRTTLHSHSCIFLPFTVVMVSTHMCLCLISLASTTHHHNSSLTSCNSKQNLAHCRCLLRFLKPDSFHFFNVKLFWICTFSTYHYSLNNIIIHIAFMSVANHLEMTLSI